MIRFLDGDAINAKIIQTIKEADDFLIIISPFIKLTERVKSELSHLVSIKSNVEIEVIIGKNEHNISKSLGADDLYFLKELPNIRISYVKDLHAKIYCSEDRLMLSSMNLHEYSQINNFEAAFVIEEGKFLSGLINNTTQIAWNDAMDFVNKIIAKSETIYKKGNIYKTSFLGLFEQVIGKEREDNIDGFYKHIEAINQTKGYCIRTGNPIPFNIKKPYSEAAYKSWQRFANEDYKEKFCHFSGEPCNGETSFKTPILKKHWRQAKAVFKFW